MKKLLLIIAVLVTFLSCKKEEDPHQERLTTLGDGREFVFLSKVDGLKIEFNYTVYFGNTFQTISQNVRKGEYVRLEAYKYRMIRVVCPDDGCHFIHAVKDYHNSLTMTHGMHGVVGTSGWLYTLDE